MDRLNDDQVAELLRYGRIMRPDGSHLHSIQRETDLRRALRQVVAERDDLRTTLAAEQGRQDGAPSEGWDPPPPGEDRWAKDLGDDAFLSALSIPPNRSLF